MGPNSRIATVLLLAANAVVALQAPGYPQARLSEAEWGSYHEREPEGPGTYAFGYDVEDPATGNTQFRQEQRHLDGSVTGSYGSVQPDGNVQVVHYTADHLGYRVRIENSIRKNEDFPPNPVNHSPEFESALASQSAPASSVHEQHVRPISGQGSQGQRDHRPITAQNHQPLYEARPIKTQGSQGQRDHRPITAQGQQPQYAARPIKTQGSQGHRYVRPINVQGNQPLHVARPIIEQNYPGTNKIKSQVNKGEYDFGQAGNPGSGFGNQLYGSFQNHQPIAFHGISKVRKVYPISDQDLRRQFSRPSDWRKMINYDFNYV